MGSPVLKKESTNYSLKENQKVKYEDQNHQSKIIHYCHYCHPSTIQNKVQPLLLKIWNQNHIIMIRSMSIKHTSQKTKNAKKVVLGN